MSHTSEYWQMQREEAEANHEAERERFQARISALEDDLVEAKTRALAWHAESDVKQARITELEEKLALAKEKLALAESKLGYIAQVLNVHTP